jgi:hypothetical protein
MRVHLPLTLICLVCLFALGGDGFTTPLPVTVTAYTWSGRRTASGKWPQVGMLAVSRDLERDLHLTFGDRIELDGLGVYRFECRMSKRWVRRADIFLPSRRAALHFGKRPSALWVVTEQRGGSAVAHAR